MNRKNSLKKRAKIRKNLSDDRLGATLRKFPVLHSLKNFLRVAPRRITVNTYSVSLRHF